MINLKQMKPNLAFVNIGALTLYFSYETCIAFEEDYDLTISENVWTKTTGVHLNIIDRDKLKRIPNDEFKRALAKVCVA